MKQGPNYDQVVLYLPLTARVIITFEGILKKELHKAMERQMEKQEEH